MQGIVIIKPDAPFGLPLSQDQWLYFFTLAVGARAVLRPRATSSRSRTGRAIMAIRDNPIAARSMGINTALYKTLTFGVSALYTGVAGALGAIVVQFVAPDSFTFSLSVALLVGLVVGGVGWLPGALFGGAFVLFVPNIAEQISKGLSGAVYGVILIAAHLPDAVGRRRARPRRVPVLRAALNETWRHEGRGNTMLTTVNDTRAARRASRLPSPAAPASRRRNTIPARATPRSRSATSCPTAARPRPTA